MLSLFLKNIQKEEQKYPENLNSQIKKNRRSQKNIRLYKFKKNEIKWNTFSLSNNLKFNLNKNAYKDSPKNNHQKKDVLNRKSINILKNSIHNPNFKNEYFFKKKAKLRIILIMSHLQVE